MKIIYSLIKSTSGHPTLAVEHEGRSLYLHSKRDPMREKHLITQNDAEKYDFLICLGAGLGYHLQNFSEISSFFSKIILIDILEDAEEIIQNSPQSFLASSENILILGGLDADQLREKLKREISLSTMKGIKVVAHPASERIFTEYYNTVKVLIKEVLNSKAGSHGAKKAFGLRYLKNALINLTMLKEKKPLCALKNIHEGSWGCIVTPGPSLQNHMPWVIDNRESLVLIAVDSAVKPLKAHGVVPDYIVSIDPQAYVYEHLQDEILDNAALIASMTVHPLVMKKAKYVFLNTHPVCQLMDEVSEDTGSVDSKTGSVAGDAIALAHYLGCENAALFGFDFSFSREIIYARDTAYQKRFVRYFQTRLYPVEMQNYRYIMKSSKAFRVHGMRSRRSFLQYRESIDYLLSSLNGTVFFQHVASPLPLENTQKTDFTKLVPSLKTVKKNENVSFFADRADALKELLSKDLIFQRVAEASLDAKGAGLKYKKIILGD